MKDERRDSVEERRKKDRRGHAAADRRRGKVPVMSDRRTRFSIFYFLAVIAFVIGLNQVIQRGRTKQIAYSELKSRIAAGSVSHVVLGPEVIRATVRDSVQKTAGTAVWTSVRVQDDATLIPLLESRKVTYE